MWELSLVHILRHEFDLADLEARIGTGKSGNIEAISPERDDFVIVEVDGFSRVRDDGANVASKEVLAFSNAKHKRAPAPSADKHTGNIRMNNGDAVGADNLPQRFTHRLDERGLGLLVAPFEGCTYQVGEHLGVRLGLKNMALLLELSPKRGVVLDHTVVHKHKAPALVKMRVGILVGHASMSRPAGMTDAEIAVRRIRRDDL